MTDFKIHSLDRLKAQLLVSGLQQENQPLYQVIHDLIGYLRQNITNTQSQISTLQGSGTTVINSLTQGFGPGFFDEVLDIPEMIPVQGPIGAAGSIGLVGPPGIDGIDGDDGFPGPPGLIGLTGPQGSTGLLSLVEPEIYDLETYTPCYPTLFPNQFYQEGTWTATVTFGGASVGITYSSNTGRFVKIGRFVACTGLLKLTSKGTSTGAAALNGLPFPVASTVVDNSGYSGAKMPYGFFTAGVVAVGLQTHPATTTADFVKDVSGTNTVMTDADFTNTISLIMYLCYIKD